MSDFTHTLARVRTEDGDRTVDAFLTDDAPGLALTLIRDKGWSVTHLWSGKRVSPITQTRGELEEFLLAIANVYPWEAADEPPKGSPEHESLTSRLAALVTAHFPRG